MLGLEGGGDFPMTKASCVEASGEKKEKSGIDGNREAVVRLPGLLWYLPH